MKILTTIWGEVKGVFGKAYLLAGLLPAGLLVLGWLWFTGVGSDRTDANAGPWSELSAVVGKALDAFTEDAATDGMVTAVLVTLGLGLVLYAGRTPLGMLLERLPGRGLDPLRRGLLRLQRSRWLRSDRDVEVQLHVLTVLDWADKLHLQTPEYLPPTERIPDLAAALDRSRWARADFEVTLDRAGGRGEQPSAAAASWIVAGLRTLYAYAYNCSAGTPPKGYEAEVAAWRALVGRRGAKRVFRILRDAANVEWAEAERRRDGFPEPEWLEPTGFGTALAALDDYAAKRYGIPTSTLLHHLGGAMPEAERKEIGDARLQLETLLNLMLSMVALAGLVGSTSLTHATRSLSLPGLGPPLAVAWSWRAALFMLVPLLLARLFYRAAVVSQTEFATKVVRAVDLHRLKLVKALGYERPETVAEERELWTELKAFLTDAEPLDPTRRIVPAADE